MAFTRVWDVSYEGTPPDGQAANQLGQRIRDLKLDIRQRADIEHDWGSSGTGRHKFPAGDATAQAAIATPPTGMLFLRTDRRSINYYNGSSFLNFYNYHIGDTTARDAQTNVPGGYLWFNTDNGLFERYTGSAWVPVNGSDFFTTKFATTTDEAMTGALATITGMSQAVTVPDDDVQYEIMAEAFIIYSHRFATVNLELRRDAVQKQLLALDTEDGRNTSMVTLIEHFTTPVNGTAYTYDVRGSKSGGVQADDQWNPGGSFSWLKIHVKPRIT